MKYSSKKEKSGGSGVGVSTVLQIVFIVLKLTNLIDWSWWWVWSPTWISIILFISLLFVFFLIDVIRARKRK